MQWLMLQQDEPEDFVIATGEQYSVREFVIWSASALGIQISFSGSGTDEIAKIDSINKELKCDLKVGDIILRIDQRYFRPSETDSLLGDPSKAMEKLGWKPETTAKEMCNEMVKNDLKEAQKIALLRKHGYNR
jgi:GDPmannose 4,6-dehydratase